MIGNKREERAKNCRLHPRDPVDAFLVVAGLSSVTSPAPLESLKGSWGSGSSLLIYVGAFSFWAFGRSLSNHAISLIPRILTLALVVNVAVGMLQVAFHVTAGQLATVPGRASGFLANPVYYGAITAGFSACCVILFLRRLDRWWLAASGFFAFGSALSGSRVAAATLLATALVIWIVKRFALSAAIGVCVTLCGTLLAGAYTRAFEGTSTIGRLAGGSDGGRPYIWRYALESARARPILGWGFGNHSAATRPYYSLEFTRDYAYNDRLLDWPDPHNVILHILVATGVIGLVLATAFVLLQVRSISNWPLVTMSGVIAATWMLQPVSLMALPIAMFLFGAAVTPIPRLSERPPGWINRPFSALVVAGVVLGAYVVVSDYRMTRALIEGDASAAASAVAWLRDPVLYGEIGRVQSSAYEQGQLDDPREVLKWYERATRATPNTAHYWAELGRRQLSLGLLAEAKVSTDQAIDLQPWSPTGWQVRLAWSVLAQDRERFDEAQQVVCDLKLSLCGIDFELDSEVAPTP